MAVSSTSGPNGGGRPPGSKNKRTKLLETYAQEAAERGVTPLEVMLEVMRHYWGKGFVNGKPDKTCQFVKAVETAKDAAPFMHPKFQAIALGAVQDPLAPKQLAAIVPKKDAIKSIAGPAPAKTNGTGNGHGGDS